MSSNRANDEMYSIQYYVIKIFSNGGFLRFPPPIKLTATM